MYPILCFSVLSVLCACVDAKPTIYMKNENDKLEPVLVPISSTVIPLPVYKVGYSVGLQPPAKPEGENKLITVAKKKAVSVAKPENAVLYKSREEGKKNRDLL